VAATAVAVVLAAVAGVVLWRVAGDDEHQTVPATSPDVDPTTATTADTMVSTTDTIPSSNPELIPVTSAPASTVPGVDAELPTLWYRLELDGVAAEPVQTLVADVEPGSSTTVWLTEAGLSDGVLVLNRFVPKEGFTTLEGTAEHEIAPFPYGTLALVASEDDPPDPEVEVLRGNEMRWEFEGEVFEFSSFGISPSMLVKHVMGMPDSVVPGCACDRPGLRVVKHETGLSALDVQTIRVGDVVLTLSGSSTASHFSHLGGAGAWSSAEDRVIDGVDGVLVDGDHAIWNKDGHWFALEGMPSGRADEILAGLRPVTGGRDPAPAVSGWHQLPDPPLSPRTGAVAVSVGDEVIVAGGTDFLCPPAADCTFDGTEFRDGAAFDREQNAWRRIADAPVPLLVPSAVSARGDAWFLTGRPDAPLVRYDPATDAWGTVHGAPEGLGLGLVVTDAGLVVYQLSDERGEGVDWIYDLDAAEWGPLPDDGMVDSYDRQVVAVDNGLLLFAKPTAGTTTVTVELYVLSTGAWTSLGDSGRGGFQAWAIDGQVVLNPHFGRIARGGVFDVTAHAWSDLPQAPVTFGGDMAGALGASDSVFTRSSGQVLDLTTQHWVDLVPVDDRSTPALAPVGRDLFLFGGQRWAQTGVDGELLDDAWLWTAPAPPATRPPPSGAVFDGLFVSETLVPPSGGMIVISVLDHDGIFGYEARLDAWDGTAWAPLNLIATTVPGGHPTLLDPDDPPPPYEDFAVGPGWLESVELPPLQPGWYRLVKTSQTDGATPEARFEVAVDAPPPDVLAAGGIAPRPSVVYERSERAYQVYGPPQNLPPGTEVEIESIDGTVRTPVGTARLVDLGDGPPYLVGVPTLGPGHYQLHFADESAADFFVISCCTRAEHIRGTGADSISIGALPVEYIARGPATDLSTPEVLGTLSQTFVARGNSETKLLTISVTSADIEAELARSDQEFYTWPQFKNRTDVFQWTDPNTPANSRSRGKPHPSARSGSSGSTSSPKNCSKSSPPSRSSANTSERGVHVTGAIRTARDASDADVFTSEFHLRHRAYWSADSRGSLAHAVSRLFCLCVADCTLVVALSVDVVVHETRSRGLVRCLLPPNRAASA